MDQAAGFTQIGSGFQPIGMQQQCAAGVKRKGVEIGPLRKARAKAGKGGLIAKRQFSALLTGFIMGHGGPVIEQAIFGAA